MWNSGSLPSYSATRFTYRGMTICRNSLGTLERLRLVDVDRVDVAGEDVADGADDHVAFFVDVDRAPDTS